MLLSELWTLFDEDLSKAVPGTYRLYHQVAGEILATLGPKLDTRQLTHQHFIRLTQNLTRREYAPSTANTYFVVTKKLLDLCLRDDLFDPVLFTNSSQKKVEKAIKDARPRRTEKLPVLPTDDEVGRILAAAWASELPTPIRERNIALVEVLRCTGMRIQEVADLRVNQVQLNEHKALITGKGKKMRTVYFTDEALNALRGYWIAREDSSPRAPALANHSDGAGHGPLRPVAPGGLRKVIDELAAAADPPVTNLTPHKFRHLFATRLQHSSHDITLVMKALGHSSPTTTQVYLHLDQDEVRQAVEDMRRQP